MKTSDELLQVALKNFADKSYEGASLSQIASEVGIKKSSIYNHFPSKEALFLAVVDLVYKQFLAEIKHVLAYNIHMSPQNQLKLVIDAVTTHLSLEYSGRFYIHFLLFPPDDLKEKIHAQFLQFETDSDELFSPLFEEIIVLNPAHPYSVREHLDAFYCLLDGITMQMFTYDFKTSKRKKEAALRVYWSKFSEKVT